MRSRYTAYTLLHENYLLKTWHPTTRPAALNLSATPTKWLGLEIKRYEQKNAKQAIVEFVVRYKINGRAYLLILQRQQAFELSFLVQTNELIKKVVML